MKELLKINGTKEINGKEVKVVEGGFGENSKCMLASDIAVQHDTEVKSIQQLINRNINRFNSNDLLNLCGENFKVTASDLGLVTSNGQKFCYLLSERGYTKLVSMMDNSNEKKWEVLDKLIDEYFTMRKEIQQFKLPNTFKEALQFLLVAEEEKEKLQLENKELSKEVEFKEDIIIGLVKTISVVEKRQRISQIVKYRTSDFSGRYKLLYSEFDKTYHVNSRQRLINAKERGDVKKSIKQMAYICEEKYMNMTNELYDVACKVFMNDTTQLMKEMWDTIGSNEINN